MMYRHAEHGEITGECLVVVRCTRARTREVFDAVWGKLPMWKAIAFENVGPYWACRVTVVLSENFTMSQVQHEAELLNLRFAPDQVKERESP